MRAGRNCPSHFSAAASEDDMKRYALIPILALLLLATGCGYHRLAAPDGGRVEITEPSLRDPEETPDPPPAEKPPAQAPSTEEEADPVQDPSAEGGQEDPEPPDVKDSVPPEEVNPPSVPEASGEGAMVALTFDDGPHGEYTDQILDILEENGAKATFFEVGRNLWNDADAVRRAEAMGCEVVNTSMGCCGKNTTVAGPLMDEREAECAGADWIVVGCPMCQVKFDAYPDGIPSMHISELVAMAAGDTESLRHHRIRKD